MYLMNNLKLNLQKKIIFCVHTILEYDVSLLNIPVGVGAIGGAFPHFTGTINDGKGGIKRKMTLVKKSLFGGFISGIIYAGLPVIAVGVGIAAATGNIWRDTDGTYVIGSKNK